MKVLLTGLTKTPMPREKTLFFIGIWIILLSNFIGLPTEIKNYLFIATALILVAISYRTNISQINPTENFFHKKNPEKKPEIKEVKFEEKSTFKPSSITSLKKESEFTVRAPEPVAVVRKQKKVEAPEKSLEKITEKPTEKENVVDLQNPFADISKSYEPIIKVRRAGIKPKAKLVREEVPIESNFNMESEEDDVIVISSDGDVTRE